MIKYALRCADGHLFESWFKDSAAFETLSNAGQLACAVCGNPDVDKAIMAPAVSTRDESAAQIPSGNSLPEPAGPLSAPASPAETALRALRKHVEKNSRYVGESFAEEARRIHETDAEKEAIWGEASLDDARLLHQDGIPVTPLPWFNRRDD